MCKWLFDHSDEQDHSLRRVVPVSKRGGGLTQMGTKESLEEKLENAEGKEEESRSSLGRG